MKIQLHARYLVVLITLLVASCIQDDSVHERVQSPYKDKLIATLESKKLNSSAENIEKIDEVIANLDFFHVSNHSLANGHQIFIVPIKETTVLKGNDRKVVFQIDHETLINFRIVVFESNTTDDSDELIMKFIVNDDHQFTGRVSMYSLYQDLLFFNEYQNGTLKVNGKVAVGEQENGRTTGCIAWYLVTTYYYSDGSTSQTSDYLGTTCDCEQNTTRSSSTQCGGGGGGGSGGGMPSNPQPGDQTVVNLPNGTSKIIEYHCYDWGCVWETIMITLPAVVVTAERNNYPFLPTNPFPNFFVVAPDGLLYTYNANWMTWTGTQSAVDPCILAKFLEQNQAIKDKMAELNGKTNLDHETGYTITKNADGTSSFTTINGNAGEASIDINVNGAIDGFLHTHYTGLLSIFSPDDLRAVGQLLNSNSMVNASTFTAAVVTASGTSYVLVIDDVDQFRAFAQQFLIDDVAFNLFSNIYGVVYNISPSNSVAQNEKSFLQMLNTTNSGLKLLKGDNGTYNDWDVQTLDADGNVSSSDCD